jgi:hypothetical protein
MRDALREIDAPGQRGPSNKQLLFTVVQNQGFVHKTLVCFSLQPFDGPAPRGSWSRDLGQKLGLTQGRESIELPDRMVP